MQCSPSLWQAHCASLISWRGPLFRRSQFLWCGSQRRFELAVKFARLLHGSHCSLHFGPTCMAATWLDSGSLPFSQRRPLCLPRIGMLVFVRPVVGLLRSPVIWSSADYPTWFPGSVGFVPHHQHGCAVLHHRVAGHQFLALIGNATRIVAFDRAFCCSFTWLAVAGDLYRDVTFLLTMTLNHAWYGEYLGLITPLLLAPSLASKFDSQSTTQTVDCLISVLARTGAGSQQRLQYCSA